MANSDCASALSAIPLFPLPNVVLLPRAILPLHIFEQRYRVMVADVLSQKESDRRFAMALLKSGWEKDYYSKPAIEPVVCVGAIITWEKLPDGNYNLLLQGQIRARIVRERGGHDLPYRVAQLAPIDQVSAPESEIEKARQRLLGIFTAQRIANLTVAGQFRKLLGGDISTSDVADLAAFNLIEDLAFKQQLLAEGDVMRRLDAIIAALDDWAAHIQRAGHHYPADPGVN